MIRHQTVLLRKLRGLIAIFVTAGALSVPAVAQTDFTFTTPDGGSVTLSSMRGNVVVLVFASTQDPQCREEFKALESLAQRYREKPVKIYWVSVDGPAITNDRLKNPCGTTGSVNVIRDQNRVAFKRFSSKVAQLPTIVVLDQQGQTRRPARGGFNPDSDFVNDTASLIDGALLQ